MVASPLLVMLIKKGRLGRKTGCRLFRLSEPDVVEGPVRRIPMSRLWPRGAAIGSFLPGNRRPPAIADGDRGQLAPGRRKGLGSAGDRLRLSCSAWAFRPHEAARFTGPASWVRVMSPGGWRRLPLLATASTPRRYCSRWPAARGFHFSGSTGLQRSWPSANRTDSRVPSLARKIGKRAATGPRRVALDGYQESRQWGIRDQLSPLERRALGFRDGFFALSPFRSGRRIH